MATHELSRTTGVYLLQPRHAAGIQALASDPAIAATTRIPHPYPENAAAEFVAAQAKAREEGTAAQFAIEDGGRLVGVCGLAEIEGGVARELGYWVGKPFWGRGYATFAVGVVLDFAFRNLGLREVRARADESNAASRRVLEKSGLRLVGKEAGADPRRKRPEEPLCVYSITAGEWRGLRDGPALEKLHPGLRSILDAELGAGNEVVETRLGWPDAGSVFVRLKHPFRAAPAAPPGGVRFAELDDPHWWKAEFTTDGPRQTLAC